MKFKGEMNMKRIICLILSVIICLSATNLVFASDNKNFAYGDVDKNGDVTIADVTAIQRYLARMTDFDETSLKVGDVNRDTILSIWDATVVQQYLAGIVNSLPQTPVKVENVKAVAISPAEIKVSWNAIAGAQKYWVNVNGATYLSTTATECIIAKRTPETTYQIYITALIDDTIVLKPENADIITITTPLDPDAPQNVDIATTASKIKQYQTDTTLTLSFMADTHYDCATTPYSLQKVDTFAKLGKIQNFVNVDFTANLGDAINGKSTKEETIHHIKEITRLTSQYCKSPLYFVRGNHDDNGWYSYGNYGGTFKTDEIINDVEWYNLAVKDYSSYIVEDENNPYGSYGYFDHEKSKIRIFILNTSDIPYIVEEDGTYRYNSYQDSCISNAQLNFMAKALMFEDKENPSEWAALFLSHVPLDFSNADNERFGGKMTLPKGSDYMLAIINAYNKGTSVKASGTMKNRAPNVAEDFMVDIDVDYSKKGPGEVIAFISGHTHADNVNDEVGLENHLSYGYTYIGVSGTVSFANFVVNRDTKTIHAVKHGETLLEKLDGTPIGTPDEGTLESGEWAVYYGNPTPKEGNLFNGISTKWSNGYTFGGNIDFETLELIEPKATTANMKLSKAIEAKALTAYKIPVDFSGECMAYTRAGKAIGRLKFVDKGDHKIMHTVANTAHLVFSFNSDKYTSFDDFYLYEAVNIKATTN